MNTPLTDILSPRWRKAVYAVYVLAGIVMAILQILDVNVGKMPDVLAYLGPLLGALAASNTGTDSDTYDAKHDIEGRHSA